MNRLKEQNETLNDDIASMQQNILVESDPNELANKQQTLQVLEKEATDHNDLMDKTEVEKLARLKKRFTDDESNINIAKNDFPVKNNCIKQIDMDDSEEIGQLLIKTYKSRKYLDNDNEQQVIYDLYCIIYKLNLLSKFEMPNNSLYHFLDYLPDHIMENKMGYKLELNTLKFKRFIEIYEANANTNELKWNVEKLKKENKKDVSQPEQVTLKTKLANQFQQIITTFKKILNEYPENNLFKLLLYIITFFNLLINKSPGVSSQPVWMGTTSKAALNDPSGTPGLSNTAINLSKIVFEHGWF